MGKFKVFATVFGAGLLMAGCTTTGSSAKKTTQTVPAKTQKVAGAKISNGAMAITMIRLLKMEAMVSIKDRQACIAELQRVGYWPKGNYQANYVFTSSTLNKIYSMQSVPVDYGEATLERSSPVTIKIYDIGTEDNKPTEIETKVSKAGDVTLPLIKRVHIAGLTPAEAAKKIRQAYIDGGIYRDLTVDVVSKAGDLFISGEVNKPGRLEFEGGMTLCELILACEGLTEFAKEENIRIIRNRKAFYYDYEKINSGEMEDPVLKPGDKVHVFRTVFY